MCEWLYVNEMLNAFVKKETREELKKTLPKSVILININNNNNSKKQTTLSKN